MPAYSVSCNIYIFIWVGVGDKHASWLAGPIRVTPDAEMPVDRCYCGRHRTEGGVAESNRP